MVDKHDLDAFIRHMEEMYHPSQSYAQKARGLLLKMLEPGFPEDQVPRIFSLAQDMYRSHATAKENIDAAQEGLKEISSNIGRVADGFRTMIDAYASSVEAIVRAGEQLSDAAQAQHDSGIELLGAAIRLQDAAEQIRKKNREDTGIFAPPKKGYEN